AAEDREALAGGDVEVDAVEHRTAAVGLGEPADPEDGFGGPGAHPTRKKSLVRKKSETRTRIEARTTVSVVARPTPSAPPRADRPWWQATVVMKKAKKSDLPSPLATSSRVSDDSTSSR